MPGNDGISFEWAVDAKMGGVDAGTKSLDAAAVSTGDLHKATVALTAAAEKMSTAISHAGGKASEAGKHAEHGFKGVGHSIDEVKEKANHLSEFIGAALAYEAIEKGIDLIKEFGMEVLHAAAGEERTTKVFELSFGVQGGKEALEYAEKFSAVTEFTEDQAKGFLNPLLQAGIPLKEMDKYMAAAADGAGKFEDKLAGMNTMIAGFSRMEMTGKLDFRMARQMHIGIEQLKDMVEFAGKSDKELLGILQKGLTKGQVMRAIAGKDNQLGDVGVAMGGLMGAKLDKLAALPERLFQGFKDSPAFEGLKGKIDDILKAFDPKSPGGQAIIAGIGDIGKTFLDVISKIDFTKVANTIRDDVIPAVTHIVKVLGDVDWAGGAEMLVKTMGVLSRMLDGVVVAYKALGWLKDSVSATEHAKSAGAQLAPDAGALAQVWHGMRSTWWDHSAKDDVKRWFGGGVEEATKGGEAIADGAAGGIEKGGAGLEVAGAGAAEKTSDGFTTKAEIESPSKLFMRHGENIAAGLAEGIGGVDDIVQGAFALPAPNGGRTLGPGDGGGISITIPITVTSHPGQSAEETGRALGEQVERIVLPMLLRALEQAGSQAGA